jgi:hypothetical protein
MNYLQAAGAAGAPVTSGSSVPTDQMEWQYAYGLLETSSLKERAM